MEVRGTDTFGDFLMDGGQCGYCHQPGIVIGYISWSIPENPAFMASSIIHRANGILGVQCGHYAAAHRQVAHIQDRGFAHAR